MNRLGAVVEYERPEVLHGQWTRVDHRHVARHLSSIENRAEIEIRVFNEQVGIVYFSVQMNGILRKGKRNCNSRAAHRTYIECMFVVGKHQWLVTLPGQFLGVGAGIEVDLLGIAHAGENRNAFPEREACRWHL